MELDEFHFRVYVISVHSVDVTAFCDILLIPINLYKCFSLLNEPGPAFYTVKYIFQYCWKIYFNSKNIPWTWPSTVHLHMKQIIVICFDSLKDVPVSDVTR